MDREPVVAGQFYPGGSAILRRDLKDMMPGGFDKVDAAGAVVPHAGYIYSGSIAGEVYALLKKKNTYVILGPNHTGYGDKFASCQESWETPLGIMDVDKDFLNLIMDKSALITEDIEAHLYEHSVEVQLPFIQEIAPDAKIVPITMRHGSLSDLNDISSAIVSAADELGRDFTVLASSDMTHYESRQSARKKDKMAIQAVLDIDAEELFNVVEKNGISMCGYIPAVTMLMCVSKMNVKHSRLVKYADSGDVTGDTEQVVGYAGIIIY